MLAKYRVECATASHANPSFEQQHDYLTDDPVDCANFLAGLLARGFKSKDVRREGVSLSRIDFDKLIRTAVGLLMTKQICRSLGIERDEADNRFGVLSSAVVKQL